MGVCTHEVAVEVLQPDLELSGVRHSPALNRPRQQAISQKTPLGPGSYTLRWGVLVNLRAEHEQPAHTNQRPACPSGLSLRGSVLLGQRRRHRRHQALTGWLGSLQGRAVFPPVGMPPKKGGRSKGGRSTVRPSPTRHLTETCLHAPGSRRAAAPQ